jgi:VWFA-related protein
VRKLGLAVSIILAAVLVLAAQNQSSSQQDVPVFKSTSRLVVLDIVVTDHTGKRVAGLTKDDFTVFEDRQPQSITQFEATVEPASNIVGANASSANKVGATPASQTQVPFTIFILDELNTTFEEALFSRRSLIKYLRNQPEQLSGPASIIAVTNTDFRLLHEYTQDRQQLIKTLEARQPEYPWKMMKGWNKDRLARSLVALQQVAAATSGQPGRKNVVWIGRGFPAMTFTGDIEDSQRITIMNAVNRTISRLLEARVTVYTIDPTMTNTTTNAAMFDASGEGDIETTNSTPDPWGADVSFADFAPATGGKSFRSRNDINNEIGESVADGATYYTLAYVPTNHSDEVKYRRIRIKMRQPGLMARTRDGYYGAEIKPTDGMVALDMSQAAQNPFAYTGLQVKAFASSNKANPASADSMVLIDARGLTWADMPSGDLRASVEVAVASFSAQSKMLAYDVRKFGSTNKIDHRKDLFVLPAGFPIPAAIPPGTKRLRFVVRDGTSGRIGTFDLDRSEVK